VQLDTLGELYDGFDGSALIFSTGNLTAVATHRFADSAYLAISMASGIVPDIAEDRAYIPTLYSDSSGALRTHAMSVLFAQNLDSVDNDLTVEISSIGASTPAYAGIFHLAAGRAARIDVPSLFPDGFNGSAIVTSTRADGSAGIAGAHVFELADGSDPNTVYNLAKAYEGFARGAFTMNMSTALCEAFGSVVAPSQSTAYAIQNIAPDTANVTVTFKPNDVVRTLTIPARSKASLQTCDVMGKNFSGSATIGSDKPIVAMGKALVTGQPAGTGTITAFEGIARGASQLSVPYVTWATDLGYSLFTESRSNIAVQNIGSADAVGVKARYLTTAGAYKEVDLGTIAAGAKRNTSPQQLESLPNGEGLPIEDAIINDGLGSVEIIGPADSELAALVRVQRRKPGLNNPAISEDYMALPILARPRTSCTCALTVPNVAPLFEPYFRRNKPSLVNGACAAANNPFFGGVSPRAKAVASDCAQCAALCRELAAREDYYVPVLVNPANGDPPGPGSPGYYTQWLKDYADMILADPCNTRSGPQRPPSPFGFTVKCETRP
jgi:hypothetical protein